MRPSSNEELPYDMCKIELRKFHTRPSKWVYQRPVGRPRRLHAVGVPVGLIVFYSLPFIRALMYLALL
jgi:hypothetical protein